MEWTDILIFQSYYEELILFENNTFVFCVLFTPV